MPVRPKSILKSFLHRIQKISLQFGFHLLPAHYYTSVPNVLELAKEQDTWARRSDLPGLLINIEEQVSNLRAVCKAYQREYSGNKIYREAVAHHFGPGYGYIEAQALHSFIRHYKPKNIIEVGSGVSTYCMQKASAVNFHETGHRTKILSIEPHPSEQLMQLSEIDLLAQKVQTVPTQVFSRLGGEDLLFIDSSHTVKVGGDVNYLILEVLPRLNKGVFVHFHDIYLPYDYQRDVLQTLFHWPETSLLHAFLCFNQKLKILFCLSLLHYDRKADLGEIFPEYQPQKDVNGIRLSSQQLETHFPSSIYLQVQ